MTAARGRWICLDGVEAAGKTTVATAIAPRLDATVVAEFSDAPFGRALAQAVRTAPHYISASPAGQSLVFLGDFFELHATRVVPVTCRGATVVHDRGYLSKYAYQYTVLAETLGRGRAAALLDHVLGLLPVPDLTVHLVAPLDVIARRLESRDRNASPQRLEFVERAAKAAADRLRRDPPLRHVTVSTDRPLDDVLNDVLAAINPG